MGLDLVSGVVSLALCALARKQKPWDWTQMAGESGVEVSGIESLVCDEGWRT